MKAKEEIEAIVHQFESMVREEVSIDSRTHPMIIGKRGMGIRKIMQDFKVDIKMPRQGDPDPDLVIVSYQSTMFLPSVILGFRQSPLTKLPPIVRF